MKRAIIVIGHGSRSAEATGQFLQVVEMVKTAYAQDLVLAAFMELASPRLADAVREAIDAGARDIIVAPCFLFQGIHIKEDIPEMLAEYRQQYPELTVRFARPLGPDPRIAAIVAERVEEIICQD